MVSAQIVAAAVDVVVVVVVAAAGGDDDEDADADANAGYQNAAAKVAVDGSYCWDCLLELANRWRDDPRLRHRPHQFFLHLLLLSSHRLLRIPPARFPYQLYKGIVENPHRHH